MAARDPQPRARAEPRRVYIREAAELLDRVPHTLRSWEHRNITPPRLRPRRDERGHRYWTPGQIDELARWLEENDVRPSRGLPHYRPTPEQVHTQLQRMRRPRRAPEEADTSGPE